MLDYIANGFDRGRSVGHVDSADLPHILMIANCHAMNALAENRKTVRVITKGGKEWRSISDADQRIPLICGARKNIYAAITMDLETYPQALRKFYQNRQLHCRRVGQDLE